MENSPHEHPNGLFRVQSTPDKGFGLFALQDLPRGTRILQEDPLITIAKELLQQPHAANSEIASQLEDLPERSRKAFLQLANDPAQPEGLRLLGIYMRNNSSLDGIAREDFEAMTGVFLWFSRINHSCSPNCEASYDSKNDHQVVHVIQDVIAGEELTVSYVKVLSPSWVRRTKLRASYGFDCGCSACVLPEDQGATRDGLITQVQSEIQEYRYENELGSFNFSHRRRLGTLRLIYDTLRDLDIKDSSLGFPIQLALQGCVCDKQLPRGLVFGIMLRNMYLTVLGGDSEETFAIEDQFLKHHPQTIPALEWSSATSTILNMPINHFENWLWGRYELA
ncbi:SET domain-containing protein [Ascobolus immersus RN42]|uniref:SET domain-containing protein n=1 Tax=Ascobolus immersus RN42 TaxID=1160509 RepID=A0A3N4I8B7_ASCIM|nr:SET domain-containing protein [Ascobolus immersus RN42]